MNKNNPISRDACMYLEGVERTIGHVGDLLNVMTDEIKEYFYRMI